MIFDFAMGVFGAALLVEGVYAAVIIVCLAAGVEVPRPW